MKHWMFRCDEVSKKVSLGMDASLPFGTRLAIRFHLWMCRHCSRVHRQMHRLRAISRHDMDVDLENECIDKLSPEARERIKTKLRCRGQEVP